MWFLPLRASKALESHHWRGILGDYRIYRWCWDYLFTSCCASTVQVSVRHLPSLPFPIHLWPLNREENCTGEHVWPHQRWQHIKDAVRDCPERGSAHSVTGSILSGWSCANGLQAVKRLSSTWLSNKAENMDPFSNTRWNTDICANQGILTQSWMWFFTLEHSCWPSLKEAYNRE